MKKIFIFLFLYINFFLFFDQASARENVTDWYIKDFETQITVNKDSSLDIIEMISADCGRASGKHGIFRIVPEKITVSGKNIATPVELINITDFSNRPLKFSQTKDNANNTIIWKIGDPKKTVQGVNNYRIHYRVKNAIRFGNQDFDEFYWNLNGNFWDLEIDKFKAKIIFPQEINTKNTTIDYYTGKIGEKRKDLADYKWTAVNILEFSSKGSFKKREGLTASIIFPKNIFIIPEQNFSLDYQPSIIKIYEKWFVALPVIVFIFCFLIWRKYGDDPEIRKPIIAEYDIPGNLTPMELGMLQANGTFKNNFISAEIVNFAVKNIISIKEIEIAKILFFIPRDYQIIKNKDTEQEKDLNDIQRLLLKKILKNGNSIKLSELKNSFYKEVPAIRKKLKKSLEEKKLISGAGLIFKGIFLTTGLISIFSVFVILNFFPILGGSLIVSGLILFIFSFIMPRRTIQGAELNHQIKGFKLYMETVDKDRAKFYEENNIFEKYLPYAIIFGITDLWVKKMKDIFGEEKFNTYSPVWLAGSSKVFSADILPKMINNLSSEISKNTSSPSGSGGSGGSGGGGGGGGGGGW